MSLEKIQTELLLKGENKKYELGLRYWVDEADLWLEATLYPIGSLQVASTHTAEVKLLVAEANVNVCGGHSNGHVSPDYFELGNRLLWSEQLELSTEQGAVGRGLLS